ncbi:heavy metal-associated domain-containing protein [Cohnella phaseoli]|uniref:heavy metal-associated domain-containing protein n=1 Tax=Cohnella phaseoli TaxID=456490 RepID=UPI00319DE8FC
MEKSIQKLGHGTAKEVVDLELVGMYCAACAVKIEKTLNKLPGVTNATVLRYQHGLNTML